MAFVDMVGAEVIEHSGPGPFDVTHDRYKRPIRALLPRSDRANLWASEEGTTVGGYVCALALEPARVERRGAELLAQLDPRCAYELLEDWERVLALPDCPGAGTTTIARQLAAYAKLTSVGLSSRQDYIDAAAKLGYVVTIENANEGTFTIAESEIGDEGDEIGDPFDQWIVNAPSQDADAQLQCLFEQHAPLHTQFVILFT